MPEPAGGPRSGRRRLSRTGAALLAVPLLTGALLTVAAGPAAAAPPSGTPSSAPATPSGTSRLCRLTDPRLPELSGLVVAGDRLLAMDDGGDQLVLYVLDRGCTVVDVRTAPVDPYDPEDLALGRDGTIWFADTGDNRTERATVALLAMRPDGTTGVYRLRYPDGPHDAEALLLAPDGTPYVVTKELTGISGVYRPSAPPAAGGTVAMARVGTVRVTTTGTPGGPAGPLGELLVTGGAVSRDGRLLALRTYTDAYVWRLTGSDVPAALAGRPTRVPLPAAPQGEAVSISEDDRSLVVAGETLPSDVDLVPLPAAVTAAPATGRAAATGPSGQDGVPTLFAALTAGGIATVLVGLGSLLARRRRARGAPGGPSGPGVRSGAGR